MKKTIFLLALLLSSSTLFAQNGVVKMGAYELTPIADNKTVAVKDQNRSSTCWAFCTVALIESDIAKSGKGDPILSEMWIVRNVYYEKVLRYVRMHGTIALSGGGAQQDVINAAGKYGLIPQDLYPGINYGEKGHVHGELDAVLLSFAKAIVKNPNKTISTAWTSALNSILDAYFGKAPQKFTYNGKEYSPKSFANELGFNANDYIYLTSFTHHPYNTHFPLEVPDNWNATLTYNLPLGQFESVTEEAVRNGYTISWATDVSDKGFKHAKGLALYPETEVKNMDNSERARWESLTPKEQSSIYDFVTILKEKQVTEAERQQMFDNYQTTDDHGMQISGLYKAQNGDLFYKVKNSWNTDNSAGDGFLYVSKPYVRAKTTTVLFNKKALSPATLKSIGL